MKKGDRVSIYPIREGAVEISHPYYAHTGKVMGFDDYFVYIKIDGEKEKYRAFGRDEVQLVKGEV